MKLRVPSPLRTWYWRRRQRGMDVRPWDALVEGGQFDGVSLAVVGNAGYLAGAALGPAIDAHDIVLRMNNFRTDGFEQAVGSRLGVFMTNFASVVSNLDQPAVRRSRFVVSSRPNNFRKDRLRGLHNVFGRNLTAGMARLGGVPVYAPPVDLFCHYTSQLGVYPTTGAMAILLALDVLGPRCRSIFLTGFSFFQGRSHYFSDATVDAARDHNLSGERELLRRRLAEPVRHGWVTLDPVMASYLWPGVPARAGAFARV